MPITLNMLKVARLPWKRTNIGNRLGRTESTYYLALKDGFTFWSEKHVKPRALWFKDEEEYEFSVKHKDAMIVKETGEAAADIFAVVDEVMTYGDHKQRQASVQQLKNMLGEE